MEGGPPVHAGAGKGGGRPGCGPRSGAGGLVAEGAGELGEAEGGGDTAAPQETQLAHAWQWFLRGQEELRFASGELEKLWRQLAEEMREVENYVDHVHTLTEARDALAAEYERENEQLRMEFSQLQLEHESQHKEVEDLLEQEGLLNIVHSSPSEQVAYLLVERSSLLEKIEALEQELGASHCLGRACVASLQDELNHFHQRLDEELREQQQSVQRVQATMNKSPSEELAGGNAICENAERGLDEAPGRILASNEEPDVTKGEQGKPSGSIGPGPEICKEEKEKEKEKDRTEGPIEQFTERSDAGEQPVLASDPDSSTASGLRKAREQKLPLEREILLLRDTLCLPDAERKTCDSLPSTDAAEDLGGCFGHDGKGGVVEAEGGAVWEEAPSDPAERQTLHKRCCQGMEDVEEQRSQLLPEHQALEGPEEPLLRETQDKRRQSGREVGELQEEELRNYKLELLHLYGELQGFQGAAEERDFLHLTHKKLLQKNALLETKVLELSHECEHLNQHIMGERKKRERFLASRLSCPELPATVQVCEDQTVSQGGDREQTCIQLLETSKMGETEKQAQGRQEEEAQLLKDILALQHQLCAHRDTPATGFGPTLPCKPRVSLGSGWGDTEQASPHEELLQQQEELQRPRWDSRRVHGSCGSAEKQLRLEQEKTLELKRQNLQLQQENIKVQAELRQVQVKLLESSKACAALASQGELCHQRVKELELQLLQQSQSAKQQGHLREQLAQESERAAEAEQRLLELEQMLKEARQQGQLLEPQAVGRKRLEEEVREAREKEAEAHWYLQEEQRKRKLLEQQKEEQQQQLRHLREKEAQLLQALAERQTQCQQQEAHLRVLEEERRTLSKEHLHYQTHSQELSQQLSALQQEKESLCDEQRQVLKQVDVSLRKHNERRLRHKARLRHTKDTLLCEVKQRDGQIRLLESEIQLSKSQAEKDQMLIRRVTSENEGLFREKRKILQQLHSLEEAKESNSQILCTIQSRVQLLEGENKQLQDRTLQLSLQVGVLERALRTIHIHSLEELRSIGFPEHPLQRKLLPFPSFSFSVTRLLDSRSLCRAIEDRQPSEPTQRALRSPLSCQTSEVSYLNVAVPRKPADLREDEPGGPTCCDRV
ncbi:coiled-coil domain-containing protein 30 isoform 2-T2 [Liasis olivaceus]